MSKNKWYDSTLNPITYFDWGPDKPDVAPYKSWKPFGDWAGKTFMETKKSFNGKWNNRSGAEAKQNVVCVKCTYHSLIQRGYECHDTDFGTVLVKFNYRKDLSDKTAVKLNLKTARNKCKTEVVKEKTQLYFTDCY